MNVACMLIMAWNGLSDDICQGALLALCIHSVISFIVKLFFSGFSSKNKANEQRIQQTIAGSAVQSVHGKISKINTSQGQTELFFITDNGEQMIARFANVAADYIRTLPVNGSGVLCYKVFNNQVLFHSFTQDASAPAQRG